VDERDLSEDLAFALHLADVAASVTVPAFGRRMTVTMKGDRSPVTDHDLAAERAIREEIARRHPDDGVLGEEGGLAGGANGRTWIVDPIDGTRLYAEGIPLWTTLIALREGGRVVLGVADAPSLGERYHATLGGGAARGGEPLRVSAAACLAEAFVVHSPIEGWLAGGDEGSLQLIASAARSTRGLSDAWAQLLVARGSADALLEHDPCAEWDWAATRLIVEEAGGRVTTFDGLPPETGRGLLVTNGRLHEEALATLGGRGG
jgi:histidinol-phosphatase